MLDKIYDKILNKIRMDGFNNESCHPQIILIKAPLSTNNSIDYPHLTVKLN